MDNTYIITSFIFSYKRGSTCFFNIFLISHNFALCVLKFRAKIQPGVFRSFNKLLKIMNISTYILKQIMQQTKRKERICPYKGSAIYFPKENSSFCRVCLLRVLNVEMIS